jgi:hypothetical protein
MTAERLAGDSAGAPAGGSAAPLGVPAVIGICDGLLGEVSRRQHRFAWLRPPGSGTEDWLVVDAYYPGNRLVIICRDDDEPAGHDQLCAELVPAHGLRLLQLAPADLGPDRAQAELVLKSLLAELGPAPARPTGPELDLEGVARESAIARVTASFAQATAPPVPQRRPVGQAQAAAVERATRLAAARQDRSGRAPRVPAPVRPPVNRRAPPPRPSVAAPVRPRATAPVRPRTTPDPAPRRDAQTVGLVVGVALAAALCAEVYFGVGRLALNGGHWLLAFGIALDACSRAVGTIAAGRAGQSDWAWGCVIVGSPAVALFALFQADGPVAIDPAPFAGLLSVLAILVIAIAAIAPALGI